MKIFLVTFIFFIANLYGDFALIPQFWRKSSSQYQRVCKTKTCQDTSRYLRKHMRLEIHPCTDFFEYVCGQKREDSNIDLVKDNDLIQYYRFLQNLRRNVTDMLGRGKFFSRTPSWLAKAQIFYRACLAKSDEKDRRKFDKIARILGEIFALGRWDRILGSLRHKLSFTFLFDVTYSMSDRYGIDIDQGDDLLLIHHELYRNKEKVTNLYMARRAAAIQTLHSLTNENRPILKKLGIQPIKDEHLSEVMNFEQKLADLMVPIEDTAPIWAQVGHQNRLSFENLRLLFLKLKCPWDWGQYLTFWRNILSFRHVTFSLRQPMYAINAIQLLCESNKTTVLQYITLRFLHFLNSTFYNKETSTLLLKGSQVHHIHSGFVSTPFSHYKTWKLSDDPDAKKEACADSITEMFPAVNLIVLERMFLNEKIRRKVRDISWHIRRTVSEVVDEIPWLKETKEFVLNKMDHLDVLISYPQVHLRADRLDRIYANLFPTVRGDYLENAFRYLRFFGELSLTPNYRNYVFAYFPFYVHLSNTVAIQGVFLQKPHFDITWPGYLLYATVGHALAHEITHGFDVNGWYFNGDGSFHAKQTWPRKFQDFWERRKKCLNRHYSQYVLPSGVGVRGWQTMAENIADIFGLQIAFRTYISSELANSDEYLPDFGDEVTREKMFFISLGRTLAYCVQSDDQIVLETALYDTHTPGKYRLLGMLRNSPEFSKAFQCKKGSFMNPTEEKCSFI